MTAGFLRDDTTGALVVSGGSGGVTTKTGTTLAGLGSGVSDGDPAILRVGTYPNIHEEELTWNAAQSKWIGKEQVVLTQSDSWAMDLGNRDGTTLLTYSRIDNAIPYGKSFAQVSGAQNVSTFAGSGVLTVNDTTSPHSSAFASAGTLLVRDNIITYTGKTGTTFTGCTLASGTGGSIASTVDVVQGYPGGFGTVVSPLLFAGELWTAGLRLQEKLIALTNAAPGGKKLTVAPYWREYNAGDGATHATSPSGGIGTSAALVSGTDSGVGGGDKTSERSFFWTENDWSDWAAGTATKRFLHPELMGKMESGAIDTGEILDAKLVVRWVG